jgi:hypothetical protein
LRPRWRPSFTRLNRFFLAQAANLIPNITGQLPRKCRPATVYIVADNYVRESVVAEQLSLANQRLQPRNEELFPRGNDFITSKVAAESAGETSLHGLKDEGSGPVLGQGYNIGAPRPR